MLMFHDVQGRLHDDYQYEASSLGYNTSDEWVSVQLMR